MKKLSKLKEKWKLGDKMVRVIQKVCEGKSTAKVVASVLLSICCVGMAQAKVDAANATGTLGVCNITNPTYVSNASTYNYVYFGNVPSGTTFASEFASSIQGTPILWRVLNTTANDDDATPALFMLIEYGLLTNMAWDNTDPRGQIWDDYYTTGAYKVSDTYEKKMSSTVRGFLQGIESGNVSTWANGNGVYQNCFSSKEQGAILTTVKTSETMEAYDNTTYYSSSLINPSNSIKRKWEDSYYAYGCPLRGDTIFLLSAEEASNQSYGFAHPSTTETALATDRNRRCKKNGAAGNVNWWWLRSPSSYSISSVVAVDWDGSGGSYNSATITVTLRFALNLHLSSVIFTSQASIAASSGFNAVSSNAPTAVAICAQLPAPTTTAVELAAASKLTIVDPDRNFSISSATISGSTITVNYAGSETGTGEHISAVLRNSNASGTHYQGRFVENVSSPTGTINMTLPSGIANGTYRLVVYNEKENGTQQTNYAGWDAKLLTVGSTNTITDVDLKGPVASGYYTGTKIKVTAQDTGSGLWKITSDAAGTDVVYTYTNAPTTQQTNEITSSLSKVYVFDQEGNKTKVELEQDVQAPTVSGFYNGTNVKLISQDQGSGLWKITKDSAGSNLVKTYSAQTTEQVDVVASDATSVYAFDQAGNKSAEVGLVQDTVAPTATVTYNEGSITINVTDAGSGIAQVGSDTTSYTTYPTNASNVAVTTGTESVTLKDALGNQGGISIDAQAPSVSGFYNGTNVKLVAQDQGSGLWKITKDSAGSNLVKTYSAETTEQIDVVASDATSVYAFDQAGNKSIEVGLVQDTAAPTVAVSHNGTNYVLTMLDSGSGIWKVTDATNESTEVVNYGNNMPTTTTTYELTQIYNQLNVYDGVGNVTSVSLKKEISEDTIISGDELGGIKVLSSCKITFSNASDITVGSVNNPYAGIEVVSGATLTIESTTNNVVNIYGGHGTDEHGSTVKYAGINVPTGATVNMQAGNTIKAYGYGVGNATGAGIGGNGVTLASLASQASANAGTINISSGTIYAYGGYASDGKSGSGAGIGGGGVYNDTQTSLTAGAVTSVAITGGTVYAYGGSSSGNYAMYGTGAGIGGGGVWDNKCTGNLVGGHVGTISISNNSTVDAIGGYTGSNTVYGSGAGIGGGGVYHESTAATITGGSITSGVSVSSTNSTRGVGGYCSTSYEARGTGAGIGGGGVYSKAGNNVAGGSVAYATFTGSGTVIVKGGFGSSISKATGAHIGGGGVYTENNATNVTVGELSNLRVSDNASINTFSLG